MKIRLQEFVKTQKIFAGEIFTFENSIYKLVSYGILDVLTGKVY